MKNIKEYMYGILGAITPIILESEDRVVVHQKEVEITSTQVDKETGERYEAYHGTRLVNKEERQAQWKDDEGFLHIATPSVDREVDWHQASIQLGWIIEKAQNWGMTFPKEVTNPTLRADACKEAYANYRYEVEGLSMWEAKVLNKDNEVLVWDEDGNPQAPEGADKNRWWIAEGFVIATVYWGTYEIEIILYGTPNKKQEAALAQLGLRVQKALDWGKSKGRNVKLVRKNRALDELFG